MRRLTLALLALPLFAASPASAQMVTVTPDQIGEIFCISRVGNDDGILGGVLSNELATHIEYAQARNDVIYAQYPDEKPPLGDGTPWASFPDYAESCSIGSVSVEGKTAKVQIKYAFPADPAGDYSDTLELKLVAHPYDPTTGIWRLDNVLYTNSGDLRTALDSLFEGY
jgi:hypothetical protein